MVQDPMGGHRNEHRESINWSKENTKKFVDICYEKKNKKEYKVIRKEGCEHYSVLVEMFDGTLASGMMGHSSTQAPPDSDEDRQLEEDFLHGYSQAQGAPSETDGDGDHFYGPFEAAASSDGRRGKSPFERRSKRWTEWTCWLINGFQVMNQDVRRARCVRSTLKAYWQRWLKGVKNKMIHSLLMCVWKS
ncbi:hypothetical protein J5N97_029639 [Dioscorea zingiberensis]|uniref:Uncharacterized protein n=1 Tax=Dioscorea zingiberensis TaxID=325984 RepID=A0A9D5BWF7_9LILI|nr:hypothetical protein J5N97_029639 [Dioscorea zingiberensis]